VAWRDDVGVTPTSRDCDALVTSVWVGEQGGEISGCSIGDNGGNAPPQKKIHLFTYLIRQNMPSQVKIHFFSAEGCFSSHNLPLAQSVRANSDLARSTPTQRRAGDDSA